MKQKILLVGDPRICPQVAYVMGWQAFEQVSTINDAAKYHDYKIVVCAFKKKSKKIIKMDRTGQDRTGQDRTGQDSKYFNLIYLDDVCEELNAEEERTKLPNPLYPPVPLWRRVIDRIKKGEVLIALLRRHRRKYGPLKSKFWIEHLPLAELKLSELFIKVLSSKPGKVQCNVLEKLCYVYEDGKIRGCCCCDVEFGNITGKKLDVVYNSFLARIVRLSSVNKSLCLCDLKDCQIARQIPESNAGKPVGIEMNLDRSCNLACPQCRNEHIREVNTIDSKTPLFNNVRSTNWLNEVPYLRLMGTGEVFYSEISSHILQNGLDRDQIQILSNGTLFNAHSWEKLKNYKTISVTISIDAATPATYQKIRGGNFQQLMQNIEMLAKLRAANKIKYFEFNFVVQKDNYQEMVALINLAKRLHVDRVHFMHLHNWHTYSKQEYKRRCLIGRSNRVRRELWRVLQDPIFQDPIVDLETFSQYIKGFYKKFPNSQFKFPDEVWK